MKIEPGGTSTYYHGKYIYMGSSLTMAEYYPFGSNYTPLSPDNSNKYLYNGKEKQSDVLSSTSLDWYDYGARFYDPASGRFHTVDLLAEKYPGLSPYAYCANNPMRFIDPTGMEFTESAWNQVNRLIDDINKRQAKNAAGIGEKQCRWFV